MNEDILVISDKSGKYLKREEISLFIIILDISGSMKKYYKYLQNDLIPNLLEKLGYSDFNDINPELSKILKNKEIKEKELLGAMSSSIRTESFLKLLNLGIINENEKKKTLKQLKQMCEKIILLITFTDNSELYFFNISNFKNCYLSGNDTFFSGAAENLKMILNTVSKRRSIRLLCFSDGEIHDKPKAMKILDEILESHKAKHQMKAVSFRITHKI